MPKLIVMDESKPREQIKQILNMFHAGVINLLQFKEVFMEHDLKSALIIVAAVFAVLLSYGIIAITSA